MACNFRIILHQDRESIHLKLTGDFDGSSACELLNTIKTCSGNTNKVFIHTEGIKDVHPFGQAVFYNNFSDVNKKFPECKIHILDLKVVVSDILTLFDKNNYSKFNFSDVDLLRFLNY